MYDEIDPFRKDRLGVMLDEAEEIYKLNPYNSSPFDSWVANFKGDERVLARRIGLVFQAKKVYDNDCRYSLSPLKLWAISRLDGERNAATMIHDYIADKNKRPSTMFSNLHPFAQRELVHKLSGIYPTRSKSQ